MLAGGRESLQLLMVKALDARSVSCLLQETCLPLVLNLDTVHMYGMEHLKSPETHLEVLAFLNLDAHMRVEPHALQPCLMSGEVVPEDLARIAEVRGVVDGKCQSDWLVRGYLQITVGICIGGSEGIITAQGCIFFCSSQPWKSWTHGPFQIAHAHPTSAGQTGCNARHDPWTGPLAPAGPTIVESQRLHFGPGSLCLDIECACIHAATPGPAGGRFPLSCSD